MASYLPAKQQGSPERKYAVDYSLDEATASLAHLLCVLQMISLNYLC